MSASALGLFDSGLGGLTVVREIRRHLPEDDLVYLADTAHVPYGGRPTDEIRRYSLEIARFLIERHAVRALVIACNTATSAAADALRATLAVPVIAMEPGVKPAAHATRTGVIGVLATVGTLASERFATLVERYADGIRVLTRPCPGWVEAIEAGEWESPATRRLVARQVEPLLARHADVLVLGCTHFPLLAPVIRQIAGPDVVLIDTSEAIVRRVLAVAPPPAQGRGELILYATGDPTALAHSASALLETPTSALRALTWKEGKRIEDATD